VSPPHLPPRRQPEDEARRASAERKGDGVEITKGRGQYTCYHPRMIFISYSSKNGRLAREVKSELESAYYTCFLAHDDIEVSSDWHEEIWKALHACNTFLGLVTDEFNASAFCQQEVGAALALEKARLLVRLGVPDPPGFAGRFQGVKRKDLVHTLDTLDMFQALRIESWISAVTSVQNYNHSNDLYRRFRSEWNNMSDDEKLRWLVAAAGNNQVAGSLLRRRKDGPLYEPTGSTAEPKFSAPFFREVFAELKPLLTDQWLFENDKKGVLHDPEENPMGKPKQESKRKKKITRKKTKTKKKMTKRMRRK
jgi:hypothetical protein